MLNYILSLNINNKNKEYINKLKNEKENNQMDLTKNYTFNLQHFVVTGPKHRKIYIIVI